MNKKIIVFTGDPNSINSEIIFKSWKKLNKSIKKRTFFISNYNLLKSQFKKLNYKIKLIKVKNVNEKVNTEFIKIIDLKLKFNNPFKVSKSISSNFVKNSLNLLHKLGQEKNISGVINLPINKLLLPKGVPGVTEFLAKKCNVKKNSEAMVIKNENLSVSPITTHIEIKNISKKITENLIINKICTIDKSFKKLNKKKPRIGLLGLNPHNAELKINSEERKIIIPAMKKLKKKGIDLKGLLVADTVFINDYKKFDVIVGMYHDQVLTPFKSLFKFNAINITLGLKYIRVSPDHGVANNIIGKNKANATSLIKCFKFISKI